MMTGRFNPVHSSLDAFICTHFGAYHVWATEGTTNCARLHTIHTDRFGDMWIGTTGGPIFRGDQQLKLLEPEQVGLAQTRVHFIEEWEDNLWIVGVGLDKDFSGISLFDPQKNSLL